MSSISEPSPSADRRTVRRRSLRARRWRRDSGCPRRGPVVDELAERARAAGFSLAMRVSSSSSRRVERRLGSGPDRGTPPRTGRAGGRSPGRARLEVVQRCRHRAGPTGRLVAGDEQVADLVEQPERADLAGSDRRASRAALAFIRAASRRIAGEVGDDEIAARAEQGVLDPVALARRRGERGSREEPRSADGPSRRMARGRRGRASGRRRQGSTPRPGARGDVLDGAAQELQARTGRTRSVHGRIRSRRRELPVEAGRQRLARQQDEVRRARRASSRLVGLADQRRDDLDAGRAGQRERLEHVVGAAFRCAARGRPRSPPAARRSRGPARGSRAPRACRRPAPGRRRGPGTHRRGTSSWRRGRSGIGRADRAGRR